MIFPIIPYFHVVYLNGLFQNIVLSCNIFNCTLFIFKGGYAGNAAGMKISSLHKLSDIRSNRPGLNLLHYVALQAESGSPELLTLPDDLIVLEEAAK